MRARKICTDISEYNKHKDKMIEKFVAKGYNRRELEITGNEVGRMHREDLYTTRKKSQNKTNDLLYITTYDNHAVQVRKSINKAWSLLQKDTKYGRLFNQRPKFVYHKGRSLANRLVRADIKKRNKSLLLTTTKKGTFYVCPVSIAHL